MKNLLLIFLLIFEQSLIAQQESSQYMTSQQNNTYEVTNKKIDKSCIKATNKELKFKSLINSGLVKNLGDNIIIEYSNTDTDTTKYK